jgi:hypothetical protein
MAAPAWEFAAGSHLLKLQLLQHKVLRTIGNIPRRTQSCDLHAAFKIQYLKIFCYKSIQEAGNIHIKT